MADTLFSSSWYRVADVTPRLRGHAAVHRHIYRGQVWYVLQDRSTGRFHRFSPNANLIIGLMNGMRTVREIWNTACTRLGDDAPTQDEVIHLLAALHRADVLQTNAPPDIKELHERNVQQKRMKLKQYIQNPLALRFPLLDPDAFLAFINPATSKLFGWAGAVLWLGVVGWALLLLGTHWNDLTKDVTDRLLSAQNLLLVSLVFPITKVIHEFGHAAAIKARGGEVHEMGIMLLVLMPVPYVDASASLAFREKKDRILVGGAGMLVELFLAALALVVWTNVEPGLVRSIAYNVIIVAGVSTLVFNANPLLRFDGYYMLSDILEIPNLGQRANAYVGHLTSRYLLGAKNSSAPKDSSSGEKAWFVFYAVASFVYRMFVTVAIALAVAERYFVFGVVLAIWSLYSVLVLPVSKKISYLLTGSELRGHRARALIVTGLVGACLVALIVWYPAPSWTRTEGVAVAPLNAHVRAAGDGLITAVYALPNKPVKKGDALVIIEDPELQARVRVLEAQLKEQEARYAAAREDRVQANIIKDEIAHIRARLEYARKRSQELVLRSTRDGIFIMSQVEDAPGRFVRRGELLAYVMDFSEIGVQVVIPQEEIDLVRKTTRAVELRLVERISEVIPAVVKRVMPAATDQLPNLALSAQGGGEVPLDPGGGGEGRSAESKAATTMFIFELQIANPDRLKALGSRIYVRFDREPEPLGDQWYRTMRRVLLKKFNV